MTRDQFTDLWDTHRGALIAALQRRSRCTRAEAEDVIQTTAHRLLANREYDRMEDRPDVLGYLVRTNVWGYLSRQRWEWARTRAEEQAVSRAVRTSEYRASLRVDVAEALRRLPHDVERAIRWHVWEGVTWDEAAHLLDLPLGTLKNYVMAGYKQLRDDLRAYAPPRTRRSDPVPS